MNDLTGIRNNNLTFKSRIVFLSPKGLDEIKRKYIKKDMSYLFNYNILSDKPNLANCYRQNVKVGYTEHVKTCTFGVCADKGKNAPLFWHVEDNAYNMEKFPILANLIKGTNAIIVGSKKNYKLSCEMIDRFIEKMNSENIPTTIIKGTKTSEASMLYESNKDTLYVCMQDIYKKDKHVKSAEDLQEACDVVKVSPTDSLEFYDYLPETKISERIKKFFKSLISE